MGGLLILSRDERRSGDWHTGAPKSFVRSKRGRPAVLLS
jgi:hypothetical protein